MKGVKPNVLGANSHAPFSSDASILLAGIRGTGKSTLAIIASTAMNRRMIDSEKTFQQATGFSSSAYKKVYGLAECRRRQIDILDDILTDHTKDAVIVCSWMECAFQALLRKFSNTNPVIHIIRDAKAIRDHLKIDDEAKALHLLNVSCAVFRSCTNYEFFNLSEDPSAAASCTHAAFNRQRSPAPYLTLKRAERHFLKFLSLIMPHRIPFIDSAFPLASIPTEKRKFTYAVCVNISAFDDPELDIEELETGADAVEIVTDDLLSLSADQIAQGVQLYTERATKISRAVGIIRRSTVVPIIYHVTFSQRLSNNPAARHYYKQLVEHGLRLCPEYVTLDLDLDDSSLAPILASRKRSRIIANSIWTIPDSPSWSDSAWIHSYRRAQMYKFDLVRFVRIARSYDDNFEVQRFRLAIRDLNGPSIPLIAYNSGPLGRHSSCFNPILTRVAPGNSFGLPDYPDKPCITALQATKSLFASFLFDAMKLYVFGANVDYSMSPIMHNAALRACGIPYDYQPISANSLSDLKPLIESPDFAGASVGLPFKVEIISLTQALSVHARAIGAANTLIPIRQQQLDEGGSVVPEDAMQFIGMRTAGPVQALYGENTDWIGIRACIRRGLSPANAVRPSSTCGLIIGAGGMARAAVYAMLQLGVQNFVVLNRTPANARKLAAHFSDVVSNKDLPLLLSKNKSKSKSKTGDGSSNDGTVSARFHILASKDDPWPTAESFRLPTIIVSCIPTHSIGGVPPPNLTLPPAWLWSPTGGVMVELAYKTLDTPLLEQVRREAHRGWVTMDGLDVLPEQGFAQFELFTGRKAPRRLMRREVFRVYPADEEGRSNLEQLKPRLRDIVAQEP